MTEDEAKKTWCPEIKFVVLPGGNVLTSRGEIIPFKDAPHYSLCTSSECQWWVWEERVFRLDLDRFMKEGEIINADEIPHEMRPYPSSGHCGAINK